MEKNGLEYEQGASEEEQKMVKERILSQCTVVHEKIKCSACRKEPIVGLRYQCVNCREFNLCAACENVSTHPHNFYKIRDS